MSNKNLKYYQSDLSLDGARVLVTGGTGSFGKKFINRILNLYDLNKVIVFSRDEHKQYEMEHELNSSGHKNVRFFIGDVRDRDRLNMALRGVDVVIHAAALKHVPTAEYNPFECIHTNIIGAENIASASIHCGVKQVIALSTDKAASPLNLYGASKLASDKIFVAANHLSGSGGCRFSVVRYGNVINSRGSVIPFFKKLISEESTFLPITDERMTRFWIDLQQGVEFVLSSLEYMRGGEIFVPKIPSMKITDLALAMAPELPHKIVGIRPGEKIHEVMITEDDARYTVEYPDRYIIEPSYTLWSKNRSEESVKSQSVLNKQMPDGFRYSSDINEQWIDGETLQQLISSV